MFSTWRRVMALRGSVSGDAAGGSQSKPRGSSSCIRPSSTSIPIRVAAMLLAVDQVRVRVVMSTPGAYRSWMSCPSCTMSRLSVTCSGVPRSKAQSEAA